MSDAERTEEIALENRAHQRPKVLKIGFHSRIFAFFTLEDLDSQWIACGHSPGGFQA